MPLSKQAMQEIEPHRTRIAGILSAMLLFVVGSIAILCGPLANDASWTSRSLSAIDGVGTSDRQTTPFLPQRPAVVVDWRTLKGAPAYHDGNTDGALAPDGIEVAEARFGKRYPDLECEATGPDERQAYRARAPPCSI